MKTILVIVLSVFATTVSAQKYSKVKIVADNNGLAYLFNEGIPVDHGLRKADEFIITDLSEYEIRRVKELNFQCEILIDDVQKFYVEQNKGSLTQKNETCSGTNSNTTNIPANFQIPSTYGGYFTYNEMLQELDKMAALYPNLISVKAPIHNYLTWENRPIYHVTISNNLTIDDGDPKVLYTAIHHAREPLSMSQLIYYMWYLLENYNSDPEVTFLVDNTQLFFVPCINPDGYIQNETTDPNGGGMHRKNKNPNIGTTNKGVDLNRNYSYGWGTTGVSTNQNNDTYPGTSAFSEPETRAIQWLIQYHHIQSAMNAHTHGDMLLFPIGTTTAEYADHHTYFQALCNHMTLYNGYEASKSSGLYPASGDSDDYMYKNDIGVGQKDTMFAMTPEIGGSFWPAASEIIPTSQKMIYTNLGLAHMVHKYYVTREDDPAIISSVTGNFHHTIQRFGRESGSATVSLEPILNIAAVGSPITYNLGLLGQENGSVSYELVPGITNGSEVKYVLTTDDGNWIRRDTITKIYGVFDELISDNAANTSNWTGTWGTTTTTYYSPNSSFTDSPGANYSNNANRQFTLLNNVDLTNVASAKISFYAKWDIERNYDYCQLQVSTDGGSNWIGQCGIYTESGTNMNGSVHPFGKPVWHGVQSDWVYEEINLSDYIGQEIKVRFILRSDGTTRKDGFYFDDFKILTSEAEEPGVGLEHPANSAVKIYPNPSKDILFISGVNENDQIEITDLRGALISTVKTIGDGTPIDISFLPQGTYFIEITGEKGHSIKQLTVTR